LDEQVSQLDHVVGFINAIEELKFKRTIFRVSRGKILLEYKKGAAVVSFWNLYEDTNIHVPLVNLNKVFLKRNLT